MKKVCCVPNCSEPSYCRSMCAPHYRKWHYWNIQKPNRKLKGHAPTIAETFWSHVAVTENPQSCWIFLRRIGQNGYGRLRYKGRLVEAHRFAFFLTHGHWPEPMCLHSCDNSRCVNPNHLSEGTQLQNMREASKRGRLNSRIQRRSPGVGDRIAA